MRFAHQNELILEKAKTFVDPGKNDPENQI